MEPDTPRTTASKALQRGTSFEVIASSEPAGQVRRLPLREDSVADGPHCRHRAAGAPTALAFILASSTARIPRLHAVADGPSQPPGLPITMRHQLFRSTVLDRSLLATPRQAERQRPSHRISSCTAVVARAPATARCTTSTLYRSAPKAPIAMWRSRPKHSMHVGSNPRPRTDFLQACEPYTVGIRGTPVPHRAHGGVRGPSFAAWLRWPGRQRKGRSQALFCGPRKPRQRPSRPSDE